MSRRFVLLIYNLLLPLALVGALPRYLIKIIRRGNYGCGFGERFGIYSSDKRKILLSCNRPLWIHAVSVGEVNVAKKLIDSVKESDPDLSIVLSTTTPTGAATAESSGASVVIYHPLDFWFISSRVFNFIDPRALVLVEAEVWPNLVNRARRRGVEVSLINARLSPKSEKRFRQFRFLIAPIFRMLSRVCVQQEEDLKSWETLGVDRAKIHFTGSIKFDSEGVKEPEDAEKLRSLLATHLGGHKKRIILAGSTHPGEELLIGKAYLELRERFPDLYYLVAPRHVERRDDLLKELRNEGMSPLLRTELEDGEDGEENTSDSFDCLIIDTTGELNSWYYASDLVVMGKSFLVNGGQNPVEAIFGRKPVFFGPNMENFSALVAALNAEGGAIQVQDLRGLVEAISEVLDNPEAAVTMVERASLALSSHRGASARTAALVLN